jgi:predicted small lipoprotein YifL
MLKVSQILVSALGLLALGVGLSGCGQRGPLYLPTDPAAANRATLPDLLVPGVLQAPITDPAPATPAAPTTPPAAANTPAKTDATK